MPLVQATLSTNLQNIADSTDEPTARTAMAGAFGGYMAAAQSNGIPLNPGVEATARAAMDAALVGMSAPGAGAAAVQIGVVAYWTALNVPGAFGVSIAPTVPPAGLAGLSAALATVFAANIASRLDKAPACDAIAAVWHPLMLGGLATFPGPVTFPIL